MSTRDEALAYAKEVYAACATIGFRGESLAALKALIDRGEHTGEIHPGQISEAAQRAHLEAAGWAGRR